jgi:hypothetical protein
MVNMEHRDRGCLVAHTNGLTAMVLLSAWQAELAPCLGQASSGLRARPEVLSFGVFDCWRLCSCCTWIHGVRVHGYMESVPDSVLSWEPACGSATDRREGQAKCKGTNLLPNSSTVGHAPPGTAPRTEKSSCAAGSIQWCAATCCRPRRACGCN